jgi:hypothetical protein
MSLTGPRAALFLLASATVLGWMACALAPRLLLAVGITDYGQWYLDSYAVLAASDAVRAGLDPEIANPLDPLLRSHSYSDWWFALRWLGLTRDSNFLVGTVWVGVFAVVAWLTARPRNLREAGWLAVLLVSPPVLLAVNRANNDLVIFALLAGAGVAAAGATWGRQLLAFAALALATGLKFYPAPAALAFLWVRPVRRMPAALLGAAVVAGVVLVSVWPQVKRGQFPVESGLHTMGSPLLGRDLGLSDPVSVVVSLLVLTVAAVALVGGRCTTGLATRGGLAERLLAALGIIVVLACFCAGVSYVYRWIFALWMALWLWRRAGEPAESARARASFRLGATLLFFCFWCDGVLCLVVNRLLPPIPQGQIDSLQVVWRLWTQPLHWLLMMLFAGWLLDAALVTIREWWTDRSAA